MINEAISSILQQEADAVRNIPVTNAYEEAIFERRSEMAASEWEKLRRTATRYKEMYPPGTRVELVWVVRA